MTIHIGAEPGEIAETVLMPGDPYRAKWAAETFLDDPKLVNEVRGMLGYTGTWKGQKVTIHGSGMGMPSLSIYANELIRDYGARTLIRIGSCGAMQDNVALRDVIIAMTASALSTPSRGIFREIGFAPCADWSLLRAATSAAEAPRPDHLCVSAKPAIARDRRLARQNLGIFTSCAPVLGAEESIMKALLNRCASGRNIVRSCARGSSS